MEELVPRQSHKLQVPVRFRVPLPLVFAFACALLRAQTPAPVPSTAVVPGSLSYRPGALLGLGGGAVVPSGGMFAYQQLSGYLGAGTYGTTVNQYTIIKGQVMNCALGGVSKILYEPEPFTAGMTGLGGGCESATGDAAGAANAQAFLSWHIGKTRLSLVLTGEKTWTTAGKAAIKTTLGLIYAIKQ